ncbi:MAG: phosphate transporter periplasmic phosphate-binding protein, partial [Dehalococcoidia bacterium]|nr:phosphate transporter periplasmic phosphate-binding protein [Dehalococcoidia bacterium]
DGSSTVFPISEAVAEEFQKVHRQVKVTVGISGTGGGFKKFCAGETDISNASRSISQAEIAECAKNGIQYIEIPVAYDGLSVMVNPQNTFVTCMTKADLKKLWEPEAQGKITTWNQIRPEWPNQPVKLYGPGTDSGTFDYFTAAINGKEKASRGDFTPSEDDNILVQGISGDRNSLGYFGYAYYVENKSKLKLVSIDEKGDGKCLAPNDQNIQDFSYYLARPIFIYVQTVAAQRAEVKEFVGFFLKNASTLVKDVGYVPLASKIYDTALARFDGGVSGTAYGAGVNAKTPLEQVFK